eukprot:symbB.v1.2.034419.t1/scaffold4439.1/size39639/1
MEAAMAVELATLGGHFFSGFGVTGSWREKQIHRRLPAIVGLPASSQVASSSFIRARDEEVEPVKEAVDSFLREGWRQERRASLERRSVDSSISVDKAKVRWRPGEKVLISGWLTKRAKLRPFQDSWQERWCELSQLPQGHGILRYSAPHVGADRPGEMHLKGEIHLAPLSGAHVLPFEDATREEPMTVSSFLEHCSRPHTDRIAEEFQHGFSLQTPKEGNHAGRVFFFATERDSETRRWVTAIRQVLAEKPQTLEDFLGESASVTEQSPVLSLSSADEKDVSEVATEDISEDESTGSFVSVEELREETDAHRPNFLSERSDLASDASAAPCSVEALEAILAKMKQFQSMKLNMASLKVRIGFDSIANPLKGLLDEKIPSHMPLHAFLGNLQLNMTSQSQRRGAAVAPLARLMGTVPDNFVDQLLQRSASWSTLFTSELTIGEVNIKRTDCSPPRSIALGQRPGTSHIRLTFEERSEQEAGCTVISQSGRMISGSLVQLFACVDVSALMTIQVFLGQLGKAFGPDIPTLKPPDTEKQDSLASIKAMAPLSLQLRLEGLEVEVPLPGMPLSGQGLRISIGQMQFSSLEALQSFAASLSDNITVTQAIELLRIMHNYAPSLNLDSNSWVSSKLDRKLRYQLEDPLSVISGTLPMWAVTLPKVCPFLFSLKTRKMLMKYTAFGPSFAVHWTQEHKVGTFLKRRATVQTELNAQTNPRKMQELSQEWDDHPQCKELIDPGAYQLQSCFQAEKLWKCGT